MEQLKALRRRLAGAGKPATLALRALTALCMGAVFVRPGQQYILPLSLALLAACFFLVWLCGFRVNAFGVMFGAVLEYYSFAGTFQAWLVPAGLALFAVFLFFASFGPAPFGTASGRPGGSQAPPARTDRKD